MLRFTQIRLVFVPSPDAGHLALAYRTLGSALDAPGINVIEPLLPIPDAGPGTEWSTSLRADGGVYLPWFDVELHDGRLQLAGKEQRFCSNGEKCGRVFTGAADGQKVMRSPADVTFPSWSLPGVNLIDGHDGWMTLLVPIVESDGGITMKALTYCAR
jgi:hypothetical protein